VAAANFLAGRGASVSITDSKPTPELAAGLHSAVKTFFGGHPDTLLDADFIVLSPGIPRTIDPLRRADERGVPVISEIELAFRHLQGTVVAITGSNGKSTTTALIGEIAEAAGRHPAVAGNIGQPLTAALSEEVKLYVVELSSFQLETVDSFRADIALLLNITPDHMDRYPSLDDYAAAKYRIFRNQTSEDVAIVNADDPRAAAPHTAAVVRRFSTLGESIPGAWFDGRDLVLDHRSRRRIPRSELALPGAANVENALAAWLTADALGITDDVVRSIFGSFRGLPHRMVLVRELAGVRFINDSKGTNVDATLKSIEGMDDGSVWLILGGKDKSGEFERLRELVSKKTRAVLTIGAAAARIGEALAGAAHIFPLDTMERAVAHARQHARAGEVVLLSPACASFDQYDNFEHRGRHFEELVHGLS
jgi:UDP-N-acetylmuramoylalanine--D-glutamate ligase